MAFLKDILDKKNPIVHTTWSIGEHIYYSAKTESWKKFAFSQSSSLSFDIDEAILNDDGKYFALPPHRPTYEEVATILSR